MEAMLSALSAHSQQAHFYPAVALPFVISCACLAAAKEDILANSHCLAIGLILAYIQTQPCVQNYVRMIYPSPNELHVFPIYPIAYLALGRFAKANLQTLYAGTFFSALAADIFFATAESCCEDLIWIGGTGITDGLVVQPLYGVTMGWLANRTRLFPLYE